MGTEH